MPSTEEVREQELDAEWRIAPDLARQLTLRLLEAERCLRAGETDDAAEWVRRARNWVKIFGTVSDDDRS